MGLLDRLKKSGTAVTASSPPGAKTPGGKAAVVSPTAPKEAARSGTEARAVPQPAPGKTATGPAAGTADSTALAAPQRSQPAAAPPGKTAPSAPAKQQSAPRIPKAAPFAKKKDDKAVGAHGAGGPIRATAGKRLYQILEHTGEQEEEGQQKEAAAKGSLFARLIGSSTIKEEESDTQKEFREAVQAILYESFETEKLEKFEDPETERKFWLGRIDDAIVDVITRGKTRYRLSRQQIEKSKQDILDGIIGFGPIQRLLETESITEVMVNGPSRVFIESKGKLKLTDVKFRDNEQVMHVIKKIIAPLGRRCDESCPLVDARLPDGSRVNAIIPPLALCGPTITIRRFSKNPYTVDDLIGFGTMTRRMADFIQACIHIKLNIVVSGGTGSGKTTTLNAISGFVPGDERIITVEDAAELQLLQDHVVSLETRPPNVEGKGAVTIRDLVRNSLRMNPDRIIVGECRGGEALDMLAAMNTGNDGSLTTGHANSPKDMVARLETMVMMAGMDLPSRVIREQIASAINIFVQQNRLQDGSRKITHITEIAGIKDGMVDIRNIFEWRQEGVDANGKVIGELAPTGIIPNFILRFKEENIELPEDMFGEKLPTSRIIAQAEQEKKRKELAERNRLAKLRKEQLAAENAQSNPALERMKNKPPFNWADAEVITTDEDDGIADSPESAISSANRLSRLAAAARRTSSTPQSVDKIQKLKYDVQERLARLMQFETVQKFSSPEEEREVMTEKIQHCFRQSCYAQNISLSRKEGEAIVQELVYEVCGLGPIQKLLDRDDITEVMVNGPDRIFIEHKGKLHLTDVKFKDNAAVMHVIQKIISPLGRRCDESSPLVDARLKDGSRVNAIIPPLALCGPTITIRKFAKDPYRIKDLINFGTMTQAMGDFIEACILIKLNIVVSGGTGSGKTTTLNAISAFVPNTERIVTVEDAAELQLLQDHVVSLETRPPNVEGKGGIFIRDLVRNSLRMNPDRIIVGECRGGEALDMLSAMNTGNDGSLTTGHANSPKDMVSRLETMVMMAGMDLPSRVIREQIASAVNIFIQQNRLQDGSRKITHVTEIAGIKDGFVEIRNIFEWCQQGVDENGKVIGYLAPTGIVPNFMLKFKEEDVPLPDGIFGEGFDVEAVFTQLEQKRRKDAEAERLRMLEQSKALDAENANVGLDEASMKKLKDKPSFTWQSAEHCPEEYKEDQQSDQERSGRRSLRSLKALVKTDTSLQEGTIERVRDLVFRHMGNALQYETVPDKFDSEEAERSFWGKMVIQSYNDLNAELKFNLPRKTVDALVQECIFNIVGFGAIQELLDQEDITEVMVNGPDRIFIEKKGKLQLSHVKFRDNDAVMQVIQKIIAPLGRRCDASCPLVDARLPDGSRVNAIIPPLALCGPTITIRKFAKDPYTIWDLIGFGTLTESMANFIEACIHIKLNIVVSGGTGSGKTTTLNAISGFVPGEERIITVEDAAELQLLQEHVVSLETRPANIEGKGAIHIRDLVRNSLRMNPDRIIVGECRGGEALDMLSAMNTGNDGSLTTGHANSPKDMIGRLETMVMMAGMDLPSRVIREQIGSAIDLIIQQNRLQDGSRKITHITEVCGTKNGTVEIRNIFEWNQQGVDDKGKVVGYLAPSGFTPTFLLRFKEENVALPDGIFGEGFDLQAAYARQEREIKERQRRELERARARARGEYVPTEEEEKRAAGRPESHVGEATATTGATTGTAPGAAAIPGTRPGPSRAQGAAGETGFTMLPPAQAQGGTANSVLALPQSTKPRPEDFDSFEAFSAAKEARLALPEKTTESLASTDEPSRRPATTDKQAQYPAAPAKPAGAAKAQASAASQTAAPPQRTAKAPATPATFNIRTATAPVPDSSLRRRAFVGKDRGGLVARLRSRQTDPPAAPAKPAMPPQPPAAPAASIAERLMVDDSVESSEKAKDWAASLRKRKDEKKKGRTGLLERLRKKSE